MLKNGDFAVVHSAIDNLLKGASGQAIHNMNISFSFPKTWFETQIYRFLAIKSKNEKVLCQFCEVFAKHKVFAIFDKF